VQKRTYFTNNHLLAGGFPPI